MRFSLLLLFCFPILLQGGLKNCLQREVEHRKLEFWAIDKLIDGQRLDFGPNEAWFILRNSQVVHEGKWGAFFRFDVVATYDDDMGRIFEPQEPTEIWIGKGEVEWANRQERVYARSLRDFSPVEDYDRFCLAPSENLYLD